MRRLLATALALTLVPAPVMAQRPAAPPGRDFMPPLKIVVLEGQDAVNSIETGDSVTPVVEIRDGNDMPVAGADVIFTLPASGPGGEFGDGSKTFRTTTNLQGQARAPYTMNQEPGGFAIGVTARLAGREAESTISQLHVVGPAEEYLRKRDRRWYKSWKFWAAVGGAIAAAIIVARSGDDKVVITPGPPTVGGAR